MEMEANALQEHPSWAHQTAVLTMRALKTNTRDLGVFWMRLIMYAMLCVCLGFVFFQLDHSWYAIAVIRDERSTMCLACMPNFA